jgi:tetratricopeptide (TPR) repeat protein
MVRPFRRPHVRRTAVASLAVVCLNFAMLAPPAQAQDAQLQGPLKEAAVALQRGQIDQAVQFYTDALADKGLSNDKRAVVFNDRGVAQMRRQQYKLAIEDFNRAVQLSPEYAPVYNNRGNALLALGVPREAIKDFDRAIVLGPSYSAAYANRASAHLRLNALDRAHADYSRAIELSPQSVSALNGRGLVHMAADRPHAAIRDFTRAVSVDARFVAGYRNRANAKAAIDRSDDVIEDLSRAIAFDPKVVDTYLLRAEAYLTSGNAASALKDFNKTIEMTPRHAVAYAGRALAYAKAEANEEALADLAKAIELDPKLSRAYAVRAWLYKQTQQLDLAQKDLERALKLEPVPADAYWAQGEIEEARQRNETAVQAYTKALTLNARHKPTLDALGRLGLVAAREEAEVASAGGDGWRVLQSGDQYVAVGNAVPALRVPLEMLGAGAPKITKWERQKAPYAGFGVLTFAAGKIEAAAGSAAEELESAAIVDIASAEVLGLLLSRKGAKAAVWKWDDGKLSVTSADGLSEDYTARRARRGGRRSSGGRKTRHAEARSGGPQREHAAPGEHRQWQWHARLGTVVTATVWHAAVEAGVEAAKTEVHFRIAVRELTRRAPT